MDFPSPSTPITSNSFNFEPPFMSTGTREPPVPFHSPGPTLPLSGTTAIVCPSPRTAAAIAKAGTTRPLHLNLGNQHQHDGGGGRSELENELKMMWDSEPNTNLKMIRTKLRRIGAKWAEACPPATFHALILTEHPKRLEVIYEILYRLHPSKTFWPKPSRNMEQFRMELTKKCFEVAQWFGIVKRIEVLDGSCGGSVQSEQYSFWCLLCDCIEATSTVTVDQILNTANTDFKRSLINMGAEKTQKEVRTRWKTTGVTVAEDVTRRAQDARDHFDLNCRLAKNEIERIEDEVCTPSSFAAESILKRGNDRIEMINKITDGFKDMSRAIGDKIKNSTLNVQKPTIPDSACEQYTEYCDKFSEFAECMMNICTILKEVEMEKQHEGVGHNNGEIMTNIHNL